MRVHSILNSRSPRGLGRLRSITSKDRWSAYGLFCIELREEVWMLRLVK